MDGSLGHFKATLQRRRERQEMKSGRFGEKSLNPNYSSKKSLYNFKELSPTELEQVKIDIRQRIHADHKRRGLLTIIIVACITAGILIALQL